MRLGVKRAIVIQMVGIFLFNNGLLVDIIGKAESSNVASLTTHLHIIDLYQIFMGEASKTLKLIVRLKLLLTNSSK